jgi:MOSC domain-containing protein YiiM
MSGSVEHIFVGDKKHGPMIALAEAEAQAGKGIVGDRYYEPDGNEPDREITLVELEAIEALNKEVGIPFEIWESRRNVVTRGVGLNDLVGKEFRVGTVQLRGIRLCDPCNHLQKMTRPGVLKGLADRGGLRAQILSGGILRVGDLIEVS